MTRRFPPGWFDIAPEAYADMGAMLFLSSLTETHQRRLLFQAVYTIETPLRLGQYHIFRQNGFPRGFVTFAGLSPEAERRFAIDGAPLMAEDYTSGASFWIVDLVAPFGQMRQIAEILKKEIPHNRVRANRMDSDLSRPRIVEWTRDEDDEIHMKVYRRRDFERLLGQDGE